MQKDRDPFALRAFQHATPFGLRFSARFGPFQGPRFSAFEVFVGVLRDQSFRVPLQELRLTSVLGWRADLVGHEAFLKVLSALGGMLGAIGLVTGQ
jgi:hypothetical protein